ncbi:VWA domain-containing protein [Desulfosediminicola flagellatus]|uniref:VWA domain-containing protein n=1 Tax=Desulfosediminicola flagellatus TaxID=2569541 RepID=UPI0010AD8B12|nr:VWA domain-containing protein [Desulfosediminicola flagellatus]
MTADLANFHFIRPVWLLLIPLAVGVWWMWLRYADPLRGWRAQIAPDLLNALIVERGSKKRYDALGLLTVWLVAVIAIAGPTWRLAPSPFTDDATPLMIILKADNSMMQPDPAPSRLERAQLKIADLAEAGKGKLLGLIAYSGSAHLVLPPTRDTGVVATMAAEIGPEIMPVPGDRLDLALIEAVRVLTDGQQGGSVVILADSITTDSALLQSVQQKVTFPLQILAINSPDSSQDSALRTAAKTLKAHVEPFDVTGKDVATIIRRAAKVHVGKTGNQGERWQEAGYWLVPLLAAAALLLFQREESGGEAL